MKRYQLVATLVVLMLMGAALAGGGGPNDEPAPERPHSFVPSGGMVPDAETAVAVAVALWSPIYGREHISRKAPFEAKLKNGVWFVTTKPRPDRPEWLTEGAPVLELSQRDARVIRVSHDK